MNILKKVFLILLMPLITLLIVISGGYRESPILLNDLYKDLRR
ncbi:hypothetical protein JCM1393_19660 [Clostridium carnis]